MNIRRSAALATGAVALAVAALSPAASAEGSRTSSNPEQLLQAALTAARAEPGVHWTVSSRAGGRTLTEQTEAGKSVGEQLITLHEGSSSGRVTIVLVDQIAYLRGNAFALRSYMDFTTAAATQEAGRWLAMRNTVPDYQAVAAGLTVASTVAQLEMTGKLSWGPSRLIGGHRATGIRGSTVPSAIAPAFSQVLYVRATGTPLIVEAVQTYKGQTGDISFGPWIAPPVARAPSGAVPFASSWLQGG